MRVQVEEGLGSLLDSRVFTGETSDEDSIAAGGVELGVDGTLREDGGLVLSEVVVDSLDTVLHGEFSD